MTGRWGKSTSWVRMRGPGLLRLAFSGSAGGVLAQPRRPQYQFDREPGVRIAELTIEGAFERAHPVPHRLRVNVQSLGHLRSRATGLQPSHERLGQALPLQWAERRETAQRAPRQLIDQLIVGEQPQFDQVVIAEGDLPVA